jgi:hypothetical protein
MTGTKDLENKELTNNEDKRPQRFNRIWGRDFFAIDGNSIKGGISGDEYDELIDFFVEMWDKN